jgi:hypothetical protein
MARALRLFTREPVARVGLDHLQFGTGGRDVLRMGRGVTAEAADRTEVHHPVTCVQAALATSCRWFREMPRVNACPARHHAISQTARPA